MRALTCLSTILVALVAGRAGAACAPMRFVYTDKTIAPYYLGSGGSPATPPGASIDLVREIAAAAGCPVTFMRLPTGRIELALANGAADAAPLSRNSAANAALAYPLDKNGQLDDNRGLRLYT